MCKYVKKKKLQELQMNEEPKFYPTLSGYFHSVILYAPFRARRC